MENLKESLKELEEISKIEELLEQSNHNKLFLENSLKKHKFKIYDSQHLPYEISDAYLEGRLKNE